MVLDTTLAMLSQSISPRLAALLGAPGQPHFSHARHVPSATPCLVWATPAPRASATLAAVRAALTGEPAMAYKRLYVWLSPYAAKSSGIVVCPSRDQYDVLRTEMGSGAHSHPNAAEVIAELQAYDQDFGLQIEGADYGTVEFTLQHLPTGPAAADLNARLRAFSPDILYASGEESFDFAQSHGRIVLWWD